MSEKPIWDKTQDELSEYERFIVNGDDKLYLHVYNNTVDKMFEVTEEMQKFIDEHPGAYFDGEKDPRKIKVIAHYFNPVAGQDWIATELSYKDDSQTIFYGCTRLFDDIGWEWGDLPSLEEMKSINMGPQFGYIRLEKDSSVNVGDSLYDVLMAIDKDALSDLGFKDYQLETDEIDDLIRIELEKFKLLKDLVDEETYEKAIYYLNKEGKEIDDIFDINKYQYDQELAFDKETIDEYFETHEFLGLEALVEEMLIDHSSRKFDSDFVEQLDRSLQNDLVKKL